MEKDFKEVKKELNDIKDKSFELCKAIDIEGLKAKLGDLEKQTLADNFWADQEISSKVSQEISLLKKKIGPWTELTGDITDSLELLSMAEMENDSSVLAEIVEQLSLFNSRFNELETLELLSGEDDMRNSFLTVHAGAGGTESQDWANMLLRMYTRWAEKENFSIEMIDYMQGEEAGIKGATILIKGEFAYGLSKGEQGVHRLVRISPFDSNKRRHTSFASVDVIPELDDNVDYEVNESELRIDTFRASGAGGQHVNTTDSAVRITHIPSGTVVSCQNERSQHKNKSSAMKLLKAKLYELRKQEMADQLQEKAGEKKEISWGNQIRSYVFQPYTMVKDHRTSEETGSVDYVLDGDINRFIYSYLKFINQKAPL